MVGCLVVTHIIIEFFCIIDESDKNLNAELAKLQWLSHDDKGTCYRNRKGSPSEIETMPILVCYPLGHITKLQGLLSQQCLCSRIDN